MNSGQPRGVLGRIFLSLFFFLFLAMGVVFIFLVGREVARSAATYTWTPTECLILSSAVKEGTGNQPYSFEVRFQFEWKGGSYTGDRHRRSDSKGSNYGDMQRLVERYPAGATARCFVNPAAPTEAVLERSALWMAFALLVPLVFIIVGVGGIWAVCSSRIAANEETRPISSRDRPELGRKVGAGFFFIFLIVGLAATWFLLVRPVLKILAAKSWTATPCLVLSSEVRSHRGKSTTYSVNILFEYEVNGRRFKSNRYSFMGGSSSGRDGKEEIVRRFPRGRTATCFVNPRDPTDAVLHRGWVPAMWFGLLPLIFVAIGLGGIVASLSRRERQPFPVADSASRPSHPNYSSGMDWSPSTVPGTGPITVSASKSRVKEFLIVIFFALIWNGVVSVFVFQAVKSWQKGRVDWMLTIVMIPFVLIGLGAIIGAAYKLLQIFAPGVVVQFNSGAVPVGGEVEVSWELQGRLTAVRKLRLFVQGREEVTYRRGTRTHTDRRIFKTIELAEESNFTDIRGGRALLKIPEDTMHSFDASNNKIIWSLQVKGDVAYYPDIDDDFTLNVLPSPAAPEDPPS
jgi:Protein of unknown function (DUF3592)